MKLITEITVDHFRSIRAQKLGDLGHFTAIVGLNNSGKSNLLRALHAFFQNETDVNSPFDFTRDYFCHDLKTKKAKCVSVTVKFDLPPTFKFRKGLDSVRKLVGNSFALKKLWIRNGPSPSFYINDSTSQLNQEEQSLVEQFLSLISFRYIPNRVLPLDIIRNEHRALRDALIRRIASKAKKQQAVFKDIERTSANLIRSLQYSVHSACPDVDSIRLATPTSWQDLIFAFGYKMEVNGVEIDDSAQGSGIQSLLMFETLSLIDRDYFQKFGWRQAAIWAVEEPEASLHSSLEARVADYIYRLANKPENRLQVFGTSHSDLILQSSDRPIIASMQAGETKFEAKDRRTVLQAAAVLGVSRWTHPVLYDPLYPVIIVEGKSDCAFLEQALRLLAPQRTVNVSYLERLIGGDAAGGDKHLQQYIKANANAIKTRSESAPVVVLLDWDSSKKVEEFRKGFSPSDPFRVEVWPESSFNPQLDTSFHGIERCFHDRIIDAADKDLLVVARKSNGQRAITQHADYTQFKAAARKVVESGLGIEDLMHVKAYLQGLLVSLEPRHGAKK